MKNIQDILKRKKARADSGNIERKPLDEKTLARVFLEAAKGEIKNLDAEDIREAKVRNKILYIKTAHPIVSSELFIRRETILEKTNEIAGGKEIEKIVVG